MPGAASTFPRFTDSVVDSPDNASDGIVVAGNAARLEHNRTEENGVIAGTSNFARLGILVFSYTTAPSGTNVALGNSDPAECKPRSLC
jgi:hypothetical protein